jgi:hypothetical protein
MFIEEQYEKATAVTTGTSIPLTRALWVGGAGNLVVTMSDGTTATFNSVPAGTLMKLAVSQVQASTTATNIVALN